MKNRSSKAYHYYVLALLTLAYTIGFIDRQILNLLVQPIKADLVLTDVQVSLLQGLAFSIGYLGLSPLFGRWVDVSPRRNILIGVIVIWSLFTALCGVVRGFALLFAARCGVGSAEAGLTPACWSIISDTFDDDELPRAFSIYLMGPYLGGGLALLAGGAIIDLTSHWDRSGIPLLAGAAAWQVVFLLVAIPGLILAALLFTIAEPVRRARPGVDSSAVIPLADVVRVLRDDRRFYLNFYLGMALILMPIYAFPAWIPALLMRRFAMPIADVGYQYGLITLLTGSIGVFAGPTIARAFAGRSDAALRVPLVAAAGIALCCLLVYLAPSPALVLAAAGFAGFCYSLPNAMAASAVQIASPVRMRGLTSSIYVIVVTIAGLALAPTAVALITDHIFRDEARVAESLAIVCAACSACGAAFLIRALPAYRAILAGGPGASKQN